MTTSIAYLAVDRGGSIPGVRVVEPAADTPQAQRGHFFAIVDLRGSAVDAQLAERILSAMQRAYYTERGTQSQVMMETVRRAQLMLQAEAERGHRDLQAGIVCMGLMPDRLALTGLGDAFAMVTAEEGAVSVHPPERLGAEGGAVGRSLALWPLHRQRLASNAAIVAGSGRWLTSVPVRTLAGTAAYVDHESCQTAAEGLREQAARDDLPGLVIAIDRGTPPGSGSGPSSGPSTGPPRAPSPPDEAPLPKRETGLPTALSATPPVVSAPAEESAGEPDASPEARPSNLNRSANVTRHGNDRWEGAPVAAMARGDNRESPATASLADASARLAASAASGFSRARELVANMLPDRSSPAPAIFPPPRGMVASAPAARGPTTGGVAAASQALPEPEPYIPPPVATGSRARLFVTLAVVLLILVPAAVGAVYWQQGATNRAEAESLLDLTEARLLSAESALDQNDINVARAMLTEAQHYLREAEAIQGRTNRSIELQLRVERDLQSVLQINRLYGIDLPLITFPAEAEPRRLLVNAQDLFVLDPGRGAVYSYRLRADGETVEDASGRAILHEGDRVEGVTVGPLVDLAWQPSVPGYNDKANLLVLDANNRIFRYDPQVDGPSVMDFGPENVWQDATRIRTFLGRLYVVDEGTNEIYRYDPGQYGLPPTNWFLPTTQVSLAGVRSMAIDGDLWLLYNDGKVVRYRQGEQLPFSLDDSVALPAQPVDLWLGQGGDTALYIADAADQRILVFDKESGRFLEQLQAAEGEPLRDMRALFIDHAHGLLFVLTDSALYHQRLPR
ncbi:MAG: hypothetical protein H3C34_06760 [Caldilineaceae bacterium]|nr:hypothetical protein [Caldilineaceae bacterium]